MSQELATRKLLLYSVFMDKMKQIVFGRSITIIWLNWNTVLWPIEVIIAFYAFLGCLRSLKGKVRRIFFYISTLSCKFD